MKRNKTEITTQKNENAFANVPRTHTQKKNLTQ